MEKKIYRVLTGHFRQQDENGTWNEYSRGDQIRMTDEDAAGHPGSFEPWDPAAHAEQVAADEQAAFDAELKAEAEAKAAAADADDAKGQQSK